MTQPPNTEMQCPACQSKVRYNFLQQEAKCQFCGFKVLDENGLPNIYQKPATPASTFLKRKMPSQPWNIGQASIQCKACRTSVIAFQPGNSKTCPFCHSHQLVQLTAPAEYEQPDAISSFYLDEAQCRYHIELKLKSGVRKFTRLFADPIREIYLNAVYLPFWVFSGNVHVRCVWTTTINNFTNDSVVFVEDVLYLAAKVPYGHLVDQIDTFNLNHTVPYNPLLLADAPVALYNINTNEAALNSRDKLEGLASNIMRAKYSNTETPTNGDGEALYRKTVGLQFSSQTEQMFYHLVLLPFWTGNLEEVDGDTLPILVNGQTGEVALGKLEKL